MNDNHLKAAGDVIATTLTLATVFKWLPAVAAFLTIIWTGMRIYEWVESRIEKRRKSREVLQD